MNFKKITFWVYLGWFVPMTAGATMIYMPANPCACDNRPCDDVVILSRDFRREGVVAKATDVKKVNKATESSSEERHTGYVEGRFDLNRWSWKNDYNSDYTGTDLVFSQDVYSSENIMGGDVAIGFWITNEWRADAELGFGSKFEDKDEVAAYTLSMPYLMLNAYYDFKYGIYLGGGVGVARSTATIDGLLFNGSVSETEHSEYALKFGVGAGYNLRLAPNIYLDFRYRLSAVQAPEISRTFWWDQYTGEYKEYVLRVKGGLLTENTFSVGLRFNF